MNEWLGEIFTELQNISEYEDRISRARDSVNHLARNVLEKLSGNELSAAVTLLYWNVPEIKVDTIKDSLKLKSTSQVVNMVSPRMDIAVCVECRNPIAINSRTALNEYVRRPYYLCDKCLSERGAKTEAKQQGMDMAEDERIRILRSLPYSEYLKSEHWQSLRRTMLKRAGYRCQICNGRGELHVHHRTYENKGDERYSDLIVLCAKCHETYHLRDMGA